MILLVYVLSPGPVIKLFANNPPQGVLAAYAPLIMLYDHFRPVKDFYDWYFHVWGIK